MPFLFFMLKEDGKMKKEGDLEREMKDIVKADRLEKEVGKPPERWKFK